MEYPAVALRRLTTADAPDIARLCNNRKVWDNLRDFIPHPYTEANGLAFVAMTEKENPPVTFGITVGEKFCGVIGLAPQSDVYRHSAEIGYWLGEPFWGKGIATAAVALITRYGFKELQLKRIFSGVMAHNKGSMRVLEKNGYELEGVFKNGFFKNGRLVDEYRFGILRPPDQAVFAGEITHTIIS